ncbi:3,4-dihydroxy-2-butanone-4-phosphate synthase [Rhodococcus aetherivorans]
MTIVDESVTGTDVLIDLRATAALTRAVGRVAAAVAALAGGGAVLVCDNVDAPTRGEVVYAAARATTELTAFTVRHTSGFLQVALDAVRCRELGLVAQLGADTGEVFQCVTVDAKDGVGTGISAADRAVTARLLASVDSTAEMFTRPGHVVPLRAQMHLPARRYGVAESAVRLVVEAGFPAAAVMGTVEGLTDPTVVASGTELVEFADAHTLPVVGVSDLAVARPDQVPEGLSLHLSAGPGRLICIDGDDEDLGFVCLVIGDVTDRSAVPLKVIAAQRLLLETTGDESGPTILLGALGETPAKVAAHRVRLEVAIHHVGSAVHEVLRGIGAHSVWCRRLVSS